MKKTVLLLVLFSCSLSVRPQSIEEIKQDTQSWLYGEGSGITLKEAQDAAIKNLLNKIRISISSETGSVKKKKATQEGVEASSDFLNTLTTYSQASISGLQTIIVKNEPEAEVFYYVRNDEVDRMFESRKKKIGEIIRAADFELDKLKIDAALRDYYWADALLQSLRNPGEVKIIDGERETLASVWLPRKIEEILENLSVSYVRQSPADKGIHELAFYYKGEPVSSLEISYMDGSQWVPCTVTDGMGVIEVPSSFEVAKLQIRYEYCFENTIGNDEDVQAVLAVIKPNPSKKAYTGVQIMSSGTKESGNGTAQQSGAAKAERKLEDTSVSSSSLASAPIASAKALNSLANVSLEEQAMFDSAMHNVMTAISRKEYSSVSSLFNAEGYEIFQRLIAYGNGQIVGTPSFTYLALNDEIFCRSLPMSFTLSDGNRRRFVEDVIFTFNKERKITNVTFGLGKEAAKNIYEQDSQWSREAKIIIVDFLENYKTAYALKRWDYLNDIFSEDALIITGKVVTRTAASDDYRQNRRVELTKKDKRTYMRDLKRLFASNKFINIKFADNNILKTGKGDGVYGIQIKQDYYSSNYSDSGFLFLMVDVSNPQKPVIHVRAWQEGYDPDWGLIGPDMF